MVGLAFCCHLIRICIKYGVNVRQGALCSFGMSSYLGATSTLHVDSRSQRRLYRTSQRDHPTLSAILLRPTAQKEKGPRSLSVRNFPSIHHQTSRRCSLSPTQHQ
jgi:hypothetical protein